VLVALMPFSLINAEAMPDLFLFSKHRGNEEHVILNYCLQVLSVKSFASY